MRQLLFLILTSSVMLFSSGCDLLGGGHDPGSVQIRIHHQVDNEELSLNVATYTNEAGNDYSVSLLEYILSDVALIQSDGTEVSLVDFHYVNDASSASKRIEKDPIEGGRYSFVRFTFGVRSTRSEAVPNTIDFIRMEWPAPMAGGISGLYHYMRLEGKYQVGTDRNDVASFLTHTGPTGGVDRTFDVLLPINIVVDGSREEIDIVMNVNEWYRNPVQIDLSTIDPPLIMGNAPLQDLILQNAATVFSLLSES